MYNTMFKLIDLTTENDLTWILSYKEYGQEDDIYVWHESSQVSRNKKSSVVEKV